MRRLMIVLLLPLAAASVAAVASPVTYQLPDETADLKPGPGVETAILCRACHSADYISTQPSKRGRAFWEAETQKMIKVYGAPINPADAAAIVDYLSATY